jgi:tetratricopeptide (TPR) repeat protein
MWWTDGRHSLSIANFICPALKENIVREMYWVVPDDTWSTAAGRTTLGRHVRRIRERYPGGPAPVRWEERRVRTTVMGRSLIVCAVDSLPSLDERVLLDIDTDYLVIPRVSYGEWDTHSPLPWRWPSELVAMLHARSIRTDFVTIAFSVEGGYTPMQWKYLGRELAARLEFPDGDARLEPYERMREGAVAAHSGDHVRAETAFRHVGDRLGAASDFCLAYVLAAQGQVEEARRCYDRALTRDPSYRSAYSTPGIPLFLARSYAAAERAFSVTLRLDPADASAHLGLGWMAARRKRWPEVEERARTALALQPDSIDAQRLLGKALRKQGRLAEAIGAYEQSLKLALAGHRPIDGVIVTDPDGDRLFDADHARTHALLAWLYERTGDIKRAIAGYRIAIAAGFDVPPIRFRVACLYARQRRWQDAWRHASAGLMQTPRSAWTAAVRTWHERPRREP